METSNRLLEITSTGSKNLISVDTDMSDLRSVSYSNALGSRTSSTPMSTSSSWTALPSNKSRKTRDFERTVNTINEGYKVLVILRGMPGSGKSYLAKKILQHTIGLDSNLHLHILSSDNYFCQNPRGLYEYDVRQIEEAHYWNQNRAFQAMRRGFSPVIIDNTNTQMWEIKPYATMAIDYGYIVEIIEPDTHWCFNDKELAKRNVHAVPRMKIKDMIDRYEKNITAKKLLSAYNLIYKFQKPPQLRLYPPIGVVASNTDRSEVIRIGIESRTSPKQTQPVESINLMNFDDIEDDVNKKKQKVVNGEISNATWSAPRTNDDIFEISSDEENEMSKDDNLLSQWGVEKRSLASWDIVTPLQNIFQNSAGVLQMLKNEERRIETRDGSTNAEEEYFRLVRNDNIIPGFYGNIKVIETVSRDINYSIPKREPQISLKPTLDKSCMTEDVYENFENHMAELETLFPGVPMAHLKYWYNKCKGDLEWTIEFLLEAKEEVISLIEDDERQNDSENNDVESNSPPKSENHAVKKKVKKFGSNGTSQEDKIEIKKELESKIDIGIEHYSQNLRRIKYYTKIDSVDDNSHPSTSARETRHVKHTKSDSDNSDMSVEIITIDSDIEIDEVDVNNACDIKAMENTVELNLGETFVSQLEERFADPNIQYPKGFLPVVQMPVSLARQLYTFYIESVYQQMENQEQVLDSLIREDEEFAKKLQAKEMERSNEHKPPSIPNLKDIMDDQRRAEKAHQTEIEKWKNLNPDTLAEKLTKQKLVSIFPIIPEDILFEVLQAHDNKYTDTVETLIASTEINNVRGTMDIIREPPIKEDVLEEMKEAQRENSKELSDSSEVRVEATHYREEANKYLKKRTDMYHKAQQYFQKGMMEVAQFYSGLASLQTTFYDKANNMAATAFLDEHSKRLEDFNTLDLHFLYVKEAIPALDLFLDRNINLLKHSSKKNSENLQIITGRGKRSQNGLSKIKPVVIKRLKKRGIKYRGSQIRETLSTK